MRQFTGFVTVDGECFDDHDEAIEHEIKLVDQRLSRLTATELLRHLSGRAPHLWSQIRGEIAMGIESANIGLRVGK